jgi:hypothetical protein
MKIYEILLNFARSYKILQEFARRKFLQNLVKSFRNDQDLHGLHFLLDYIHHIQGNHYVLDHMGHYYKASQPPKIGG